MKLIATRDFRNTHNIKFAGAKHPSHVHKGAAFEIDEQSKGGSDLIAALNASGLVIDQKDQKSVDAFNLELAEDKKRADSDAKAAAK